MSTDHFTTPYDDDPLMLPAFLGCVSWALGHEPTLAAYRAATADNWRAPASPSERMIDQATGADRAFLQRFSDWTAQNVFGMPDDVYGEAHIDDGEKRY